MRISDWSSDVCSSDLNAARLLKETGAAAVKVEGGKVLAPTIEFLTQRGIPVMGHVGLTPQAVNILGGYGVRGKSEEEARRSEEHTSELQSLMRISYAVFCLTKKNTQVAEENSETHKRSNKQRPNK